MERYAPTLKDLAPRDMSPGPWPERSGKAWESRARLSAPDLTHLGKKRIDEKLSEISSFVRIYLGLDRTEI